MVKIIVQNCKTNLQFLESHLVRSLVAEPFEDLFKFSQLLDAELLELLVNLVVVGPSPVEGQALIQLACDTRRWVRHPRLVTVDSIVVGDGWLGELKI